jgi:alpha-amylase
MASKRRHVLKAALRLALALALGTACAAPPDAWRSRSVYQLLVDRFAAVPQPPQCADFHDYCGGTFAGVAAHLDYIQALGFDAVWISPVVDNAEGGYHGYWQRDMYSTNAHFGSAADLAALSAALHARGMLLMVDVVANHASSDADVSANRPFSSPDDYHDCAGCPADCNVANYEDLVSMEHCRLAALRDFNNTDPAGLQSLKLYEWIASLVANYSVDGLRVDTLPYVHPAFWQRFTAAAGGLYAVGEVDNGDVRFVAPWQAPSGVNAALTGVLSYPLFYTMRSVWAQGQAMEQLGQAVTAGRAAYADTGLLGVFTDNHDNPRFMHETSDRGNYRAALAYSILSDGIPIVYYGSEWFFAGGNDPGCREPLWSPGISYNASASGLGPTLAALNAHRRAHQLWQTPQVERFSDNTVYAFSKGTTTLAVFTNVGAAGAPQTRTLKATPWAPGTKLCSLFGCEAGCATVAADASLEVTVLGEHGVAVFSPSISC